MEEVEQYLQRIGMDAHVGGPSIELLTALQLAHMTTVPFENLHVFHRRGPRTDVAWSWPKVVEQRRGGWCFELNGAFGALLDRLGFAVDYVSCQVWDPPPVGWGPDLDHLALVVTLDDARWLVDVGFGDNCVHPLLIETSERDAIPKRTRLDVVDGVVEMCDLVPTEGKEQWERQLRFTFMPRALSEFEPRSLHLRTDPASTWWKKPFATRATDGAGGRITLRSDTLRITPPGGATEVRPVAPSEWSDLLLEHFGLSDTGP